MTIPARESAISGRSSSDTDSTVNGTMDCSVSRYEIDFYAWTQEQAQFLHEGQWHCLDRQHLIEEIESLGRQQRQELRNRLAILLGHLLKWQHQPEKRSRSWLATLRVQRLDIADLVQDSPSLQPYLEEALAQGYRKGVALAVAETGLPWATFPKACPYSLEQILSDRFYPGDPNKDLIEEAQSEE